MKNITIILFLAALFLSPSLRAAVVPTGSGSYVNHFPGVDAANRNSYPSGSPQVSGRAVGKPIPTNDWWSALLKENHVQNLFSYPFTMKTIDKGLVVSYIPFGVIDDLLPVTVGLTGLSAPRTTVSDYSDWTVTMNWENGSDSFEATAGIAMPFLYFTKQSSKEVSITVTSGIVAIEGEILVIEQAKNGASFAVYAPAGSTWSKTGGTYTSSLNEKNYWSLAFIPLTATDVKAVAAEYKRYAYVFPASTVASYSYNEQTAVVTTQFVVTPEVKEGDADKVLLGLLPHQWAHLAASSARPEGYSYASVRGEIKTLAANSFVVANTFHGILPTLPYVQKEVAAFSAAELNKLIGGIQNDVIDDWTDSYNDGQLLNRLVQTARIAAEVGNTSAVTTILATVKARIENWLRADAGEVAFLFYYNNTWTSLLGYPSGHGQDNNINDHHFHWGYFIHAAAFVEQYQPGWAAQWGPMVDLLVRDAAGTDRVDPLFPYLRNFSPYAGHSWANGFATFPQGNDQESTSESMQFHSSLIHWGTITGNNAIRDLGIYLYTTEQTAIEEYWMDIHKRNFPPTQQYSLVSRVWGNSFDNGTFWTADIAASYGIELYPIHGGSLYLAHNEEYVTTLWNEISRNTGILRNEANANLWHDVMWQYQAFADPEEAIKLYDSYPQRSLKFGVSNAQTYHWLHSMAVLGKVNSSISADYPIAAVFNKSGRTTYVAHNYGASDLTVRFSDGYLLSVPPRSMATASEGKMVPVVSITAPYNNSKVIPGSVVMVTADAVDYSGTITHVDFYCDDVLILRDSIAPYSCAWQPLAGAYTLTARALNDEGSEGVSKPVSVSVTEETVCSVVSTEATQGSFEEGYKVEFETLGKDVVITFELLDNRSDLVAFFWNYTNGFQEAQMSKTGDKKFSFTLSSQVAGSKVVFAGKFAFAGGMSVTKKIEYVVGTSCGATSVDVLPSIHKGFFYPNPVTSQLHLRLPNAVNKVQVWTVSGQLIIDRLLPSAHTLDLGRFPAGTYFIRVINGNEFITDKFIKL